MDKYYHVTNVLFVLLQEEEEIGTQKTWFLPT